MDAVDETIFAGLDAELRTVGAQRDLAAAARRQAAGMRKRRTAFASGALGLVAAAVAAVVYLPSSTTPTQDSLLAPPTQGASKPLPTAEEAGVRFREATYADSVSPPERIVEGLRKFGVVTDVKSLTNVTPGFLDPTRTNPDLPRTIGALRVILPAAQGEANACPTAYFIDLFQFVYFLAVSNCDGP